MKSLRSAFALFATFLACVALGDVSTQMILWSGATPVSSQVNPCASYVVANYARQGVILDGQRYKCIKGQWTPCGASRYFVHPGAVLRITTWVGRVPAVAYVNVADVAEYADVGIFSIVPGSCPDATPHQASNLTIYAANFDPACQSCSRGFAPNVYIDYGAVDRPCVHVQGQNYGPTITPGETWCAIWDEWVEYQYLVGTCVVGDFMGFSGGYGPSRYLIVAWHSEDWSEGALVSGIPWFDPRFARGDFNQDGAVGVQDIFDFLAAYLASSPRADADLSGTVEAGDLFSFVNSWFESGG